MAAVQRKGAGTAEAPRKQDSEMVEELTGNILPQAGGTVRCLEQHANEREMRGNWRGNGKTWPPNDT